MKLVNIFGRKQETKKVNEWDLQMQRMMERNRQLTSMVNATMELATKVEVGNDDLRAAIAKLSEV